MNFPLKKILQWCKECSSFRDAINAAMTFINVWRSTPKAVHGLSATSYPQLFLYSSITKSTMQKRIFI